MSTKRGSFATVPPARSIPCRPFVCDRAGIRNPSHDRSAKRAATNGGLGLANRSFEAGRADGCMAPMNEPARAGGERASRSAQFRRGDAQ